VQWLADENLALRAFLSKIGKRRVVSFAENLMTTCIFIKIRQKARSEFCGKFDDYVYFYQNQAKGA